MKVPARGLLLFHKGVLEFLCCRCDLCVALEPGCSTKHLGTVIVEWLAGRCGGGNAVGNVRVERFEEQSVLEAMKNS